MNRLPNKRPVLLPTKRELKYLATFLLGGWVFLGVRELLSHLPSRPSDADRWAASAKGAGVLTITNPVAKVADADEVAAFMRDALHRHDGEKWSKA